MASNQYVNKVIYGDQAVIDLTSDTVSSSVLKSGYTAHDASGAIITGMLQDKSPTLFNFVDGTYKIQLDQGIYSGNIVLPGIKMSVPSSGTNEFYIDFPDNSAPASDADWTRITFSVDTNGNSNIIQDIAAASGVSF